MNCVREGLFRILDRIKHASLGKTLKGNKGLFRNPIDGLDAFDQWYPCFNAANQ